MDGFPDLIYSIGMFYPSIWKKVLGSWMVVVLWMGFIPSESRAERALQNRPNIVLIMPDEIGYGDYACLGNPMTRTPSVDAFKEESLLFTQFHVSPTCAPTRAALLSGRHEFKNGVTHTIQERERMTLKTFTLAQMLQSAGYTTGIFGKWHLGDEEAYRPENRGFDEVYIHGGGGIGQTYPGSCGDAPGNSNIDPTLWHNGKFEKTKGYCTDLFFTQAIRWMEVKHQSKQPFFAYITPNAAHSPHVVPESDYQHYLGKPGVNEETAKFFGMLENIDTNFGVLLKQLKEWGIENNTLVIYIGGDNGGTEGRKIFNAGLNGGKGSIYQGEHEAIIDLPLWNEVHEILVQPKQSRANRSRSKTYALLSGLVRCHHCGRAMSESQGTGHTGALYRYYRCQGSMRRGADSCQLSGLNAINLESVVVQHLRHVLASPEVLARIGPQIEPAKGEVDHQQAVACMKRIDEVWEELFPMERNRIAKLLIDKVVVALDRVVMRLKCRGFEHLAMEIGGASVAFPEDGIAEITLAVQAKRRCGRTTLIRPADPTALAPEAQVPKPRPEDEAPDELTLALARAFEWQRELEAGKLACVSDLARRENVHESYIRRQLQLTLLAPATVRKILDGTHDWAISLRRITKQEVSAVWTEQEKALAGEAS